ncbi:ph-response sensor protein [Exophiala dermatitidis]|uniref:Ph-response sensor protein n=1 Tax=Exophiala dermatitidis TaxID=5970 RepID=A0AAN6IR25_EXODE|nr:ph-response sensor protein [Exophiala dermatitidis]KAJ4506453.1 ph-response sensor protein [Exophiala dermatitidis]KAJ4533630.1 ph-response sensor protein [Exophiala dermatitidis]KAJ4547438.1 ph-response sensor protein [Exophiala dermatitidis]KAJ4560367.1 ph-response sensor protein [Exophiala dermatitidis]
MARILTAMPLESLLTNPNPAVPRPRSILSYFSSSLGKHARNMFDLVIEPEDPFRVYSPGQTVKGHVTLSVLKGFDITHLVISLHGYAKVYKHQIAPGDGVLPAPEGLVTGKGNMGFQYHGNGLASLFQYEQVLCGTGFLKKHVYKFAFEVPFPEADLPSTIDFERGTICYMLTATVTRPTTISPTVSRSVKVKFQDRIDIGVMYSPKSRVVTLEPVSRRGKVKVVKPASTTPNTAGTGPGLLTRNNTQNSTISRSTNSIGNPPLSPAPSEDTVQTSTTTPSTHSSQAVNGESQTKRTSPRTSDSRSNTTSSAHTITATAELPRHGALPGDTIPIRVSVTHTKSDVRGMIIATLYRQGRVDMHPAIPLAKPGKDNKAEYEDVYPKSRTGLGGLYFANASPSSVFRKDLAQSSTMMIVNPATMTADITTSLKVPDTAFPTIANVPGGMISFTYHVEVVVDLFGKLGETRLWPRLTSSDPVFSHSLQSGNQLTNDWSHTILDTTQLRRTKSVVTFEMSLVVGNQDSRRGKKQTKQTEVPVEPTEQWAEESWNDQNIQSPGYDGQYYDQWGYPYYHDQHYDYNNGQDYTFNPSHYHRHPTTSHEPIPPPEPHEEEVDEKTRLRRQEQLLFPSQPPPEGEASHSHDVSYQPSAPLIPPDGPHEDNRGHPDGHITSSPLYPAASTASARSGDTIRAYPTPPPTASSLRGEGQSTDDKQELERRRLLAQASAPPQESGGQGSSRTAPSASVPSAPIIHEQDEYNVQTLNHDHVGAELPQYER